MKKKSIIALTIAFTFVFTMLISLSAGAATPNYVRSGTTVTHSISGNTEFLDITWSNPSNINLNVTSIDNDTRGFCTYYPVQKIANNRVKFTISGKLTSGQQYSITGWYQKDHYILWVKYKTTTEYVKLYSFTA